MGLMAEHQVPTAVAAQTVVADSPYGTAENFLACADQFVYDAPSDTYPCPAGQILRRYQKRAHQSALGRQGFRQGMRPVCIARTLYHQQAGPAHSTALSGRPNWIGCGRRPTTGGQEESPPPTTSERREFC